MEYPKTQSLWKREEKTKKLIPGEYSLPEFDTTACWWVEEKVDGTNIRIIFKDGRYEIRGRKDNSEIPAPIIEKLNMLLKDYKCPWNYAVYYGEGYGGKIQAAGPNYGDVKFCLFDICTSEGFIYHDGVVRDEIWDIAKKMGATSPAFIGWMNIEQVVDYVKSNPLSLMSEIPMVMEGVICRNDRGFERTIFKLKCIDMNKLQDK